MLPTTPPNLTAHGTILGTFQYMAPEQLEGQEADARTDIYAFGSVLYEMITGTEAFEGKSQATLIAAIISSEPPIAHLQPLAPSSLIRVVVTCLAKDPEERWQNSRDLLREVSMLPTAGGMGEETTWRERRSPLVRGALERAETRRLALSLATPGKIRKLQKARSASSGTSKGAATEPVTFDVR